jgi:SAM-dependent methyltransferase
MYKTVSYYFKDLIKGKILGISGIEYFRPLIDKTSEVLDIYYPDADMQRLPYEDLTFDLVISDQVLEHVEIPQKAVDESYRVLKKGGIAIHTSCFINYVHPFPLDFWRFSPEGLRHLCRNFSEVIDCGGWGNRVAILLTFISDRFRFMNIPECKMSITHLIATYNEKRYPIVTWIVAKK